MNVYVPAPGWVTTIDRGSGIVNDPNVWATNGGRIVVDYEGNRFGASNIVTFADRVMIAAGRHTERYPTIARSALVPESLIRVGTYDGIRVDLDHQDLGQFVADWIGCEESDLDYQLGPHQLQAYQQRIVDALDAGGRMRRGR